MKTCAYAQYRHGDIGWVQDVPSEWRALPLKRSFRIVNGGTPLSSEPAFWDGDIVWLTPEDLGKNDDKVIANGRRNLTTEGLANCGAALVPPPSLIVSTRAPIGHVAVSQVECCTNQGCRALVALRKRASADYFYYAILAANPVLQAAGKGTTFLELSTGALGQSVFPLPTFDEQRAIAGFLDRETARLDKLVGKKRELIERLKEKRTALISRTVTRGLSPNVKLKPSSIEWLGDVPEHWEVKQLKWAVMFQRGHDLPADAREGGPIPLVTSAGISSTHSQAAAKAPGIVTGRYGTIGEFYLIEEDYWPLNTTLYTISLRGNQPRFLRYMLSHLSPLFLLNAVKSAVPGVDRNDIHPTKTAVPPVPEQHAIADFLDRETAKIDKMIEKVEAAIEKLQEYRTALITAAVTGKIDVRGEANSVGSTGALAAGTLPV